jgi:hypothetical protein
MSIFDLSTNSKMTILSFSDANYQQPVGDPFPVQVNPESYKLSYKTQFDDTQAPGSSAADLRFNSILPNDMTFEFLFDNSGVLTTPSLLPAVFNPFSSGSNTDVTGQLDDFMTAVIDYSSNSHQPLYVKLVWGTLLFMGRLTSLDVNYTLFGTDGTPIRAIATATFRSSMSDTQQAAADDNQSPDITHVRTFKTSDSFPLMTGQIYGSKVHYIDAAGFNQLNSFRKIPRGTQLYFPPLSS